MVELIQSYSDSCAAVERVANKPQDTSINVIPHDFQHETAERLEVLRRTDRYEKALAIKDQVKLRFLRFTVLYRSNISSLFDVCNSSSRVLTHACAAVHI
jgi:hypothetical protein